MRPGTSPDLHIEALFVTFKMRTKETMNRLLGTLGLTEVRAVT
jgi:hypothetical protein